MKKEKSFINPFLHVLLQNNDRKKIEENERRRRVGGGNHIQNKYIYLADENQKVLKLGECQND